jgi:hypothetical protein
VGKCEIGPSIYSDHNIINLEICSKLDNERGRGFWKLNTSLLRDKEYVNKINKTIEDTMEQHKELKNLGLLWDTIKMKIRGASISYASYKAKCNREYEMKLENSRIKLEQDLVKNPSEELYEMHATIKREVEALNNERSKGIQIRAKCTHIELNEHSSKYFFSKEKSQAETKSLTCLQIDENNMTTDSEVILEKQREYYENLYRERTLNDNDVEQETQDFFSIPDLPQLHEDQKEELDNEITIQELTKAVKELPVQKTPGSDGLPSEFYKFFWSKISTLVFNSIKYGIENSRLSLDQRRGVLTLIPKKDKDLRNLKNWRPLSLLNTDYKILAKLLALRIRTVLPKIISYDQSGCIQGRSTFSNIRSTIDVIQQAQGTNAHGILAFIDYEKAFDSVRWKFLYRCLERLNFGKQFRAYVETLYRDIETCVTNNGHASKFFQPTRGIRQGCPISANLFVSIVEILAHAIRQDPRILGLLIGMKEFKISQFADDTCLYLSDENSLQLALKTIEKFAVCSGLNLNRDKSEAIWIAASSNFRHKPCEIKWSKCVTSLGVKIGNDLSKYTDENFRDKITKIENLAKQWCLRKLTLQGKVLVANTLFMSQLLYVGSCMYTPLWVIQQYKEIVTRFIWNNKPPKVKYTAMINSIAEGGLNLHDLESKLKSIKLGWIKKLYDKDLKAPWKANIEQHFNSPIIEIIKSNMKFDDFPKFNDKFYNDMWQTWSELHYKQPENISEVCNQRICNNSSIRVNCKPIFKKEWNDKHLKFIRDIITDNGTFLSEKNINSKYNLNIQTLEYNSLKSAIPSKWKKILKDKKLEIKDIVVENECQLNLNKMTKQIMDITTKEAYKMLLASKSQRPTSEKKWRETELLQIDEDDWPNIYECAFKLTTDTKLQTFQFKITHRILACKENLYTWKIKENNKCNFCESEIDTLEHHLVMCNETLEFWNQIRRWWKSVTGTNFTVGIYDLIFGLPNENKDKIINQFNFLLLLARFYIYKNKQAANNKLHVYELLIEVKTKLEAMHHISLEQNREKKFEDNWSDLYNGL